MSFFSVKDIVPMHFVLGMSTLTFSNVWDFCFYICVKSPRLLVRYGRCFRGLYVIYWVQSKIAGQTVQRFFLFSQVCQQWRSLCRRTFCVVMHYLRFVKMSTLTFSDVWISCFYICIEASARLVRFGRCVWGLLFAVHQSRAAVEHNR